MLTTVRFWYIIELMYKPLKFTKREIIMKRYFYFLLCLSLILGGISAPASAADAENFFTAIIDSVKQKNGDPKIIFSNCEETSGVYTMDSDVSYTYLKNGEPSGISSLTEGAVVTVYYDGDDLRYAQNVRFEICDKTISGRVEDLSDQSCTVDGKQYDICGYLWLSEGEWYTFSLDITGRIANARVDYSKHNYAVFEGFENAEAEEVRVKLITFSGDRITLKAANEDIIRKIDGVMLGEMLEYSLDSNGRLSEINNIKSYETSGTFKANKVFPAYLSDKTYMLDLTELFDGDDTTNDVRGFSLDRFREGCEYTLLYSKGLEYEDGSVVLCAVTQGFQDVDVADPFSVVTGNKNGVISIIDRNNPNGASFKADVPAKAGDIIAYSIGYSGSIFKLYSLPSADVTRQGITTNSAEEFITGSTSGGYISTDIYKWDSTNFAFGIVSETDSGYIELEYPNKENEAFRVADDCFVMEYNALTQKTFKSDFGNIKPSYEDGYASCAYLKIYNDAVTDIYYIPSVIAQESFEKIYNNPFEFNFDGAAVTAKGLYPLFDTPAFYAASYSGSKMLGAEKLSNGQSIGSNENADGIKLFTMSSENINKPLAAAETLPNVESIEFVNIGSDGGISIKAEDIVSVSSAYVEIRGKKYRLDNDVTTYVNGYLCDIQSLDKYLTRPDVLTIYDTDGNGWYDVIKIKHAHWGIVKDIRVSGQMMKIYFSSSSMAQNSIALYTDGYHGYRITDGENEIKASDIAVGDVLTLYFNSEDDFVQSKNVLIEVTKPFIAAASEASRDNDSLEIIINSKKYFTQSIDITAGINAIWYVTSLGEIVDVYELSENTSYGIIDRVYEDRSSKMYIRIITADGKLVTLEPRRAQIYSDAKGICYSQDGSLNDISQRIVSYRASDEGKLASLSKTDTISGTNSYNARAKRFGISRIDDSTKILDFSEMNYGDWQNISDYSEDDFCPLTMSALVDEKPYEAVICDSDKAAQFMLILKGNAQINEDTPFSVVESVRSVSNDDGNQVFEISLYTGGSENVKTFKTNVDCTEYTNIDGHHNDVNRLNTGDVIIFTVDSENKIKSINRIFSAGSMLRRGYYFSFDNAYEYLSGIEYISDDKVKTHIDKWDQISYVSVGGGIPVYDEDFDLSAANISRSYGNYFSSRTSSFYVDENNVNVFVYDPAASNPISVQSYSDVNYERIPSSYIKDDSYLWSEMDKDYGGYCPGFVFYKAVYGDVTDILYIAPAE